MSRHTLIRIEELVQIGLDDLRRIWADLPEMYQDSLVKHPQTPSLLLWHAVKTDPIWAEHIGWAMDHIPEDLVWDLFLHRALDHGHIYHGFVRHPSVREDLLIVLTELGGSGVRCEILDHRNLTDEVLERLTHDPHRDIRRQAVKRLRARKVLRSIMKKSKGGG